MTWPRRSKYRNRPTRCRQNVLHQSGLEAGVCDELHVLQAGGLISELEAHPQPVYRFEQNGVFIGTYRADFRYLDEHGALVGDDAKGVRTREYEIKRRLMLAFHGIEVEEIRRVRGRR